MLSPRSGRQPQMVHAVARFTGSKLFCRAILGLAPQALCFRPLSRAGAPGLFCRSLSRIFKLRNYRGLFKQSGRAGDSCCSAALFSCGRGEKPPGKTVRNSERVSPFSCFITTRISLRHSLKYFPVLESAATGTLQTAHSHSRYGFAL